MAIKGCILPWLHVHGNMMGRYKVCCVSAGSVMGEENSLGDCSQPVSEVWNGEPLRRIRRQFLAGEVPAACRPCYELEACGITSRRQGHNATFAAEEYRQAQTGFDGSLDLSPLQMDVRFSNVCNFKCRSCAPVHSSSWHEDWTRLDPGYSDPALIDRWTDNPAFWEDLPRFAPHLREVCFSGGEPMMQEGHYKLLEWLASRGHTGVTLIYNTNLSTLRYRDRDVLSLWSRFQRVALNPSCDGVGRRGEYIRKGLDWELFQENLERVRPHVKGISAVFSLYNVFGITDLVSWAAERGWNVSSNILTGPEFMSAQVLPPEDKKRAIGHYRDFFTRTPSLTPWQWNHMNEWLRFMMKADESRLAGGFVRHVSALDRLRGESFLDVFPEHAPWYARAAAQAPEAGSPAGG